jgi:hypothetical protein
MKNVPVIDELRAVRQRLAQDLKLDVRLYAAMLREVARTLPGYYVNQPVLPPAQSPSETAVRHAG